MFRLYNYYFIPSFLYTIIVVNRHSKQLKTSDSDVNPVISLLLSSKIINTTQRISLHTPEAKRRHFQKKNIVRKYRLKKCKNCQTVNLINYLKHSSMYSYLYRRM